jgi:hypothetical protein
LPVEPDVYIKSAGSSARVPTGAKPLASVSSNAATDASARECAPAAINAGVL